MNAPAVTSSDDLPINGLRDKADGRVSEQEIAVTRAMMERLQLSASQRRAAIDCFTEGKRAACRCRPFIGQFSQQLPWPLQRWHSVCW